MHRSVIHLEGRRSLDWAQVTPTSLAAQSGCNRKPLARALRKIARYPAARAFHDDTRPDGCKMRHIERGGGSGNPTIDLPCTRERIDVQRAARCKMRGVTEIVDQRDSCVRIIDEGFPALQGKMSGDTAIG